jgi:DNA-binding PadR family transcriptional regulator
MVPDTRYAILGLLRLRGPSHGYGLRKLFGELLGPGWEINRGQVYEMLSNLVEKHWVECLDPPGTSRDSKTYRITPEGEREFADWHAEHPQRSSRHRDALYLRLVLAEPGSEHHLLEDIAIAKQTCLDKLAAYTANACPLPEAAGEWERLAREAIDEDVTTDLHAKLEWLEKLRRRVEHHLAARSRDAAGETDVTAAPSSEADSPGGEAASPRGEADWPGGEAASPRDEAA